VQEEPKNMGSWAYVQPRFYTSLIKGLNSNRNVNFVGRKVSPSPATGFPKVHKAEIAELLEQATTV